MNRVLNGRALRFQIEENNCEVTSKGRHIHADAVKGASLVQSDEQRLLGLIEQYQNDPYSPGVIDAVEAALIAKTIRNQHRAYRVFFVSIQGRGLALVEIGRKQNDRLARLVKEAIFTLLGKPCSKCGVWKLYATGYRKEDAKPDGVQSKCRECKNADDKAYFFAHQSAHVDREAA